MNRPASMPLTAPSIITGTSAASTAHARNLLILLQLLARHPANARAVEVGLLGLDAPQTTQLNYQSQLFLPHDHTLESYNAPSHSPASSTWQSESHQHSCS